MKMLFKILLLLFSIIIVGLIIISIYNHCFSPFKGEDKEVLKNYENYDMDYPDCFAEFYIDYIDYNKYEEKYDTKFYYNYGKKSLFNCMTLIYYYPREAYSYVIYPNNEYEILKKEILDNVRLIDTPVGYDEVTYVNNINIDETIYNEIYFMPNSIYLDYYPEELYLKDLRTISFWFSYNDDKKEISFSYLYLPASITSLKNISELSKMLERNLY